MNGTNYLDFVTPISDHAHVFVWAGNSDYPIPEGYLCSCGLTTAYWKICPHCGNKTLCAVPINSEITYTLIDGKLI